MSSQVVYAVYIVAPDGLRFLVAFPTKDQARAHARAEVAVRGAAETDVRVRAVRVRPDSPTGVEGPGAKQADKSPGPKPQAPKAPRAAATR